MQDQKIKDWENIKHRLLRKYPQLTMDDLLYESGKEVELLERLTKKLEESEEEIKKWLSWMG